MGHKIVDISPTVINELLSWPYDIKRNYRLRLNSLRWKALNPEKTRASWNRVRETHKERYNAENNSRRRAKTQKVAEIKAKRGCAHCGIKDHRVLTFHHREPEQKEFTLGRNINNIKWTVWLREATKCDVLCHNCHHIIHYEQGYAPKTST